MAIGPTWFHGIDALITFAFCVVTLLVMLRGYRAYCFFKDDRCKLHSFGFLFLSASYFIISMTHLLVAFEETKREVPLDELMEIKTIIWTGFTLHALLLLTGITFLLILYLKINDRMVRALLFIIVLFSTALNDHIPSMFYFLLATLLLFIIIQLVRQHEGRWRAPSALVLAGFCGILLGEVLLGAIFMSELMYVISHIITLIGFLCILASQILVGKHTGAAMTVKR